MVKKCNNCGFQQNEFLNLDGRDYCKSCNSEINVNSSQTLVQKQKTAHEMRLAFSNFHNMMEPFEEYIEKAHSDIYSDFKNKRQRYKKTITNNRPVDRLEDLFLTQLFIIKGAIDKEASPFREDFYKWINYSRITSENCPKKLAHFLIEIDNVLNGNGEKIVEQTRELIKGQEINPWDMPKIFGDLQGPMNRNREQGRNLAGKNWNEVEIEGRFKGNADLGKRVFEQISKKFTNHDEVNFFPQNVSQREVERQRELEYLNRGDEMDVDEVDASTKHYQKSQSVSNKINNPTTPNSNNGGLGTIAIIGGILALASLGIYGASSVVKKSKKVKK